MEELVHTAVDLFLRAPRPAIPLRPDSEMSCVNVKNMPTHAIACYRGGYLITWTQTVKSKVNPDNAGMDCNATWRTCRFRGELFFPVDSNLS